MTQRQDTASKSMIRFLLATAMHKAGKFELVSVVEMGRQRH